MQYDKNIQHALEYFQEEIKGLKELQEEDYVLYDDVSGAVRVPMLEAAVEALQRQLLENKVAAQGDNLRRLLSLAGKNPGLPILPMVNGEIAKNSRYHYWAGRWGKAETDYYFVHRDEILLLSDGIQEIFEKVFDYGDIGVPPYVPEAETNKRIRQKVMTLPWKKAIIVYIEPEEDGE